MIKFIVNRIDRLVALIDEFTKYISDKINKI